jgi:hypothetical protein
MQVRALSVSHDLGPGKCWDRNIWVLASEPNRIVPESRSNWHQAFFLEFMEINSQSSMNWLGNDNPQHHGSFMMSDVLNLRD